MRTKRQFQHPLHTFRYPSESVIAAIRADLGEATRTLAAIKEPLDEEEEDSPTVSHKATLVLAYEREDSRATIPTPTLRVARMGTKVLPRVKKVRRLWTYAHH